MPAEELNLPAFFIRQTSMGMDQRAIIAVFDVAIEAVGLPSTFQNCIDAACFGGRVVLIGVGKQNLDFNFTLIQKKELDVYGSRNSMKKDFLELIDTLPENSFADLVWRGEPGRWDWFLARHNGLLYAEVPGFEKPLYRRYEDFRKQVGCVDVPMDIESRADSLKQWSD